MLAMLAVLAAVHLALNFALTPNTPFPFSPDDFAFLGMGLQDLGWDWKRPVSANIIFVVAAFGAATSDFVLNASALAASPHHEARMALAARYAAGESVNRRMLELLERHRPELWDEPVIGLHGLDGPSPWCGNGPLYLARKRGFGQRWIVFANAESACYQTPRPGGRKPRYELGVSVVPPARACAMEPLPVLVFEADGSGRLARGRDLCAEAGP